MIYSCGYAKLSIEDLRDIIKHFEITRLIDVRFKPHSRISAFNRSRLEAAFGNYYEWRGNELGGMPRSSPVSHTTPAGLTELTKRAEQNLLLMCVCEAPGNCHRYSLISLPLLDRGIDVQHIYQDHVVSTAELKKAIDAGNQEYVGKTWREP